jgi:hypothetical protein
MRLKTGGVILGINDTGRTNEKKENLFSVLIRTTMGYRKRLQRLEVPLHQIEADRGEQEIREMIRRGTILS